jgi:hypothetical protein
MGVHPVPVGNRQAGRIGVCAVCSASHRLRDGYFRDHFIFNEVRGGT